MDEREQIDGLSRLLGRLEEQIKTLFKKLDDLEERSTLEHRAVQAAVAATSDAVRTLTASINEMKPLTDDYREKRAEARGAKKLALFVYVTFSGLAGAAGSKFIDWFMARPHP